MSHFHDAQAHDAQAHDAQASTLAHRPGRAIVATLLVALVASVVTAVATPAQAAGSYTVGGTVTLPAGFLPTAVSPGTAVTLTSTTGAPTQYGSYNRTTGVWSANHVPDGTYRIEFDPGPTSGLGSVFYPSGSFPEDAAVVTVAGDRTDLHLALLPQFDPGTTWVTLKKGDDYLGFPYVGDVLRAAPPTLTPAATSLTHQWLRDGQAIPGATNATYTLTPDDVGSKIGIALRAYRSGYAPREFRDVATFEVFGGSFNQGTPTITGTATFGNTLTVTPGTWTPTPTFTYQWKRNGVNITGATTTSYTLVLADVGTTVSVEVTGALHGYNTSSRTRTMFSAVGTASFTTVPTVAVTGTVRVGEPLQASVGTWTPVPQSVAYQWFRSGAEIAGATSATYTPVVQDIDKAIVVRVTASHAGYTSTSAYSPNRWAHPGVFAGATLPTISGTLKAGSTLTAKPGTWTPAPTLSYQWFRDGVPISGAKSTTYKLTTGDRGKVLSVGVTGVRTGYVTATRNSAGVVVPRVFTKTTKPTISGTRKVGAKLTAKLSAWTPATETRTYQWYRNGKAISGAKASTYVLTNADSAKKISVKVTGKRSGYLSVTGTSSALTMPKFFTKRPAPTISGKAKVGSTLSVRKGTWSPKPSSYSYRWYREGKAISGATKSSYKVVKADAGKKITVKVTAKRSGYAAASRTSKAVSVPAYSFTKAPTPVVTGTPAVGASLTARAGTWSPAASLSYHWFRNGVAISGASRSTYVVTEADAGAQLKVRVTARRTYYKTTAKVSAAVVVPAPTF